MKRMLIAVIVILSILPLGAVTYKHNFTKSVKLQGAYRDVVDVTLMALPAQSHSFMQGMPFNIEDAHVQYGATEKGRTIASWDLITNCRFSIKVEAENLHPIDDPSVQLPYELIFSYNLGWDDADGSHTEGNREFSITSGTGSSTVSILNSQTVDNSYIGFAEGYIFFQFTESATAKIKDSANYGQNTAAVPSGNYTAYVTVTIIPAEKEGI